MKINNTFMTREWLVKADSDWQTINILIKQRKAPNDIICFHCQQYVEKLLKAFLTLKGIETPKTHDIRKLCELALSECPELLALIVESDELSDHAVDSRYPGDSPKLDRAYARKMMKLAEKFAKILLSKLKK
jgi:HEPN domain-containing protein